MREMLRARCAGARAGRDALEALLRARRTEVLCESRAIHARLGVARGRHQRRAGEPRIEIADVRMQPASGAGDAA